ncbi:Protein ERD1-like protein [Smittium mucronatum]|uniref:Protein ERD1-like protein n=1 Tax=Smittium mucronatum TaxID=133383 RepID=A0A1R0GTU8_9FUNG|nr:Protein ERD1-like protein [Smittium mucronatum]
MFSVCKTEFSDVVFADILTSCSKVFADLANVSYVIYQTLKRKPDLGAQAELKKLLGLENDSKSISYIRSPLVNPTITCIPYLIRLKQCVCDFYLSPRGSIERRRHLANAIKYFSSFPVIFLSAFQKDYFKSNEYSQDWFLRFLFYTWLFSAIFNSLYSFYWDITFDWGLGNLKQWNLSEFVYTVFNIDHPGLPLDSKSTPSLPQYSQSVPYDGPFLLRKNLVFKYPSLYYLVIVLDFVLRATWTIKLSSHITIDSIPYSGFILGALEIFRRCMWILFRVEKEAV